MQCIGLSLFLKQIKPPTPAYYLYDCRFNVIKLENIE